MLRPLTSPRPALAILRRAPWRRFGAALALVGLLLQGFGLALNVRAHAAVPGDAAAICHAVTGDDDASGAADDGARHGAPACPLCLALQHLGKLLPPGDAAILLPPAPTPLALATPDGRAIVGRGERPHLPRGPPHFG
jgi:hypothetical protein